MNNLMLVLAVGIIMTSCKKNTTEKKSEVIEQEVNLPTHRLMTYPVIKNTKYLVVFEAGLGDDHSVWTEKNLLTEISGKTDLVVYDRAGYGKSGTGTGKRNIETLSSELKKVVENYAGDRRVILVGHSLGGMIIRDYAIKNPSKIAALLFVDPSHEYYNQLSQIEEDLIYNSLNSEYGPRYGGTQEARSLIEDSNYMATLPALPNVPTIVISSMKIEAGQTMSEKEKWFAAHERLGIGVNDFTHITTTLSGHYIMKDEPDLMINSINSLFGKLP